MVLFTEPSSWGTSKDKKAHCAIWRKSSSCKKYRNLSLPGRFGLGYSSFVLIATLVLNTMIVETGGKSLYLQNLQAQDGTRTNNYRFRHSAINSPTLQRENESSLGQEKVDLYLMRSKSKREVPLSSSGARLPSRSGGSMSFGQLVLLAQEEAKCMLRFGGQLYNPTPLGAPWSISTELYNPFLCSKSSNQFAQCELCRNLTSRTRSVDECSILCGTSDKFCKDLCTSINQIFSNNAKNINYGTVTPGEEDYSNNLDSSSPTQNQRLFQNTFPNSQYSQFLNNNANSLKGQSEHSLFSQIPHVFCEGVLNRSEGSGSGSTKVSTDSWDGTLSESTNHFIVLKWNIAKNFRNLRLNKTDGDIDIDVETNSPKATVTRMENDDTVGDENGLVSANKDPIVFVIEKFSKGSKKWEALGKTPFNLQTISVTFQSDTYKWRITAVGPQGIMDQVTSPEYVTLNGYIKPGPPKKIYVVQTVPLASNNSVVNVLIGWDPPEEKACFYKIVLETHEGAMKPYSIRIKEPLGMHRHWFTLQVGMQYSVLITSRDPSWDQHSESNLTRLDFKTPTCLESYDFRFDKCVPPPPRDIQTKILKTSEDGKNMEVLLSWKPPQNSTDSNPIHYYNVTISRFTFKGGFATSSSTVPGSIKHMSLNSSFPYNLSGSTFSKHMRHFPPYNSNSTAFPPHMVPGKTTQLLLTNLIADTQYTVMIRAIASKGPSKPAQHHLFTKIGTESEEPQVVSPLSNWLYLAIPVCIMMFILIACNVGRAYLHKRQVKQARNQYFQSMEERDALSADWSIVPLNEETSTWKLFDDNFPKEKWEILSENLIMGEVIGQGAFGVVRRAKILRKKLQLSTIKYLDKNTSYLNPDKIDADLETVAVKMLKVSATREDREQLIKEILTMQSLGLHPQIVGLIGACTRGRSLSLVLEYCPGGDLLSFTRKVRAKYWPTLGLSDCNDAKKSTSSSLSRGGSTSGTRSGRSGIRLKNLNPTSEDSSPINYADIEGFSDYSSSLKSQDSANPKVEQETALGKPLEKGICPTPSQKSSHSANEEDEDFHPIDEKDVLSYARQIAMGMEYLEKNRIVHRDLACRNCLLMGDHRQVKLSDFGLSRDIYTWNVYHQKSNGKLPIKWMGIESIFSHVFTTKSDVWSYGIVLWELVTLGGTPYPGLGNAELFHLLKSGYRMERPDNCSEELYALMKKCWRTSPAARPTFTELRNYVQNMMEAAEPNLYLSLMADIPSDYFRLGSRSDLLQMNPDTPDGSAGGLVETRDLTGGGSRHGNSRKYAGYHNTNSIYKPLTSPTTNTNITTTPTDYNSNIHPKLNHRSSESGSGTSGKTSSRSNSIISNGGPIPIGSSGFSASCNSSFKFTLGPVPERRPLSVQTQKVLPEEHQSQHNHVSVSPNSNYNSNSCNSSDKSCQSHRRKHSLSSLDSGVPRSESGFVDGTTTDSISMSNRSPLTDIIHTRQNLFDRESGGLLGRIPKSITLSDISDREESAKDGKSTTSPLSLKFPYPFKHVNNVTIIENKTYDLAD